MGFIQFSFILAGIYLLIGLFFALAFVIWGVGKLDEAAVGSTIGFRLIIIPGCAVFWPLLLKKWIQTQKANKS